MTELKKIVESKTFRIVLGFLGCLIGAVIIFAAGVHVGLRKASYSSQWGQNYERNFIGEKRGMMGGRGEMMGFDQGPRGMMRGVEGRDFRNGHGIGGTITSVSDNTIVIKDRDNKENTIVVTDKTLIKSGNNDIKITDLKNDQNIVVIGQPGDNGVVNADLIRVFDNNNQ